MQNKWLVLIIPVLLIGYGISQSWSAIFYPIVVIVFMAYFLLDLARDFITYRLVYHVVFIVSLFIYLVIDYALADNLFFFCMFFWILVNLIYGMFYFLRTSIITRRYSVSLKTLFDLFPIVIYGVMILVSSSDARVIENNLRHNDAIKNCIANNCSAQSIEVTQGVTTILLRINKREECYSVTSYFSWPSIKNMSVGCPDI
ncbi:hypothetical protein [Ostreibacterium oceani]|uniref:Uncharacterized protein n=1 Tax=Ostreibacterium oceani TaxID=2654998 RepID=A0A6N7EU55_9GAMM|nr:hypothetical protein [Ostreibacterium oceani]MPV85503.1 hypothetical protein [Ostreibacterium oceani]